MNCGTTTVKYWNFIDKHEYIYEAAKNNKTVYPYEEPTYDNMQKTRILKSYPYINTYIDITNLSALSKHRVKYGSNEQGMIL